MIEDHFDTRFEYVTTENEVTQKFLEEEKKKEEAKKNGTGNASLDEYMKSLAAIGGEKQTIPALVSNKPSEPKSVESTINSTKEIPLDHAKEPLGKEVSPSLVASSVEPLSAKSLDGELDSLNSNMNLGMNTGAINFQNSRGIQNPLTNNLFRNNNGKF